MARPSKGPWLRKGRGWWVWNQGVRVYLSHDEGEAKRLWHKVQSGEPLEDPAAPHATTFADAMEAYCTEIERTRTERHLRGTHWRLNQLCEHWAKRPLSSLKLADVESVLQKKTWGPTTQANVLTSLRGLLRWASRPGGLIPSNPLPVLTLPRAETRVNVLSKKQIAALLKAAGPELRLILKALAETGARPSELIRAKASDCDADGTAIRLARGKQGRRLIFFPPGSRKAIAELRKKAVGHLFRQPNGDPWSEFWFYTLVRKARDKAGLPKWATSYALRHTWATERLKAGRPIATVARMMGTSVTLLDKCYGHFADQDLREEADGMG